jgi:uncharacterized protein (DUF1697 family)
MAAYAAFLRAVNVGGTGKLPMSELRTLCEGCGFEGIATYIQSGNVVFRSRRGEAAVKKLLEQALEQHMGKAFGAMVRSAAELQKVLESNPFPSAAPNRLLVMFLDAAPAASSVAGVVCPDGEELALVGRELFLHFPKGLGQSKLKLPFRDIGTARNLNTVRKVSALLDAL